MARAPQLRRFEWTSACLLVLAAACGGGTEPSAGGGIASIELQAATRTLQVGDALTLKAVARDAGGADLGLAADRFAWTSSRPAVASVDAAGRVTALAADTVTITAASAGHAAALAFTVASVPAAAVSLSPDTLVIATGQSAPLALVVTDAAGRPLAGRAAAWSSSDSGIVRVSPSGAVTAVAIGSARVAAIVEGKADTAHVEVTPVPVAAVSIAPRGPSLAVHDTLKLQAATLDGSGAALAGRSVAWTALDAGVVSIGGGRVVGAAAGTARVVAASEGKADTIAVTVTPARVASVVVTPLAPSVAVYGTVALAAAAKGALGETLSGRAIAWSSLDPALASVTDGIVTGKATGTARIVAASEGKADTAQVSVTPAPVASVTVAPDSSDVAVGATKTLSATLLDEQGRTLTGRTIAWSSSASAVAAVSASGVVTGKSAGTVTITAASEGRQGTARVRVPVPDSLSLASLTSVTYCTWRDATNSSRPLKLDVLYPSRVAATAALPVAIWVHGGAWEGDNINSPLYTSIRDELLKRGYAVVPIHYRLSGTGIPAYGPKPWPAPIQDARCAVRYLRAHADELHLDPDRIGAWGQSAGGHIVAMMATTGAGEGYADNGQLTGWSSRVQAVAALSAITDLTRPSELPGLAADPATMQAEFPAWPDTTATSIVEASPVHWASAGDVPMLLVHGAADATVDAQQSVRLDDRLRAAGASSTLDVVPNADHSFNGITTSARTAIVNEVAGFMDANLK